MAAKRKRPRAKNKMPNEWKVTADANLVTVRGRLRSPKHIELVIESLKAAKTMMINLRAHRGLDVSKKHWQNPV